jgi:alpha-tubulin suppressor-like RCC1 family protein
MSSIKNTLNNTPNSISSNETSSSVVTCDGELFMTGMFRGEQTNGWRQILDNDSTIGPIVKKVDIENNKQYLLNRTGSVYEFTGDPTAMREVYSPIVCNSNPAVDIVAGMGHVVIHTKNGKVYGVGRNDRFQIVPNGQCYYSTATECCIYLS